MNRLNKFLLIFLMLSGAMVYGIWQGIQSQYFATIVTEYLNKELISKIDANVDVKNIKISIIPLGTHLDSVVVKKEKLLNLEAQRISLLFSPWDFLRQNLKVNKIVVKNGQLATTFKSEESKKESQINVFKEIKENVIKKIPFEIGSLSLEEIQAKVNTEVYNIKMLDIYPYSNSIDFNFKLENLVYKENTLDQVSANIELLEHTVRIRKAVVNQESVEAVANGSYSFKDKKMDLKASLVGFIDDVIPTNIVREYEIAGFCNCTFNIEGTLKDYRINSNIVLENGNSKFLKFTKLESKALITKDKLEFKKVKVSDNKGSLEIVKPFNLNVGKSVSISELGLSLSNINLKTLVHYVDKNPTYNSQISGKINVKINKDEINIESVDDITVKDLSVGNREKVIDIKEIKAKKVSVGVKNKKVDIKAMLHQDESEINLVGSFGEGGLNLESTIRNISLKNLGGTIGQSIQGVANLNLNISGSLDDIRLRARNVSANNLAVLGYTLEKVQSSTVVYHFNKSRLELSILEDLESKILINGFVNFKDNNLNLNINGRKVSFAKLPTTIKPVWKNIGWVFSKFAGDLDTTVELSGSFDDLKVDTSINTNTISVFNEVLDETNVKFIVDKHGVKINKLKVKKGTGHITSDLDYNFNKGVNIANVSFKDINLVDLKNYRTLRLGYDGRLQGQAQYSNVKGHKANGVFKVTRARIGREVTKPSTIEFDLKNNFVKIASSLLGGELTGKGVVYFGDLANRKSNIDINVNVKEFKKIFGILSVHNIYDTDLTGEANGHMKIGFKLKDYANTLSIKSVINKLSLKRFNKEIKLKKIARLDVSKSNIKKMSMELAGTGGFLSVSGKGDINKDFKIEQKFNLDMVYLGLITPLIERAEGTLEGTGVIGGNYNDMNNFHEFVAKNIFLKVSGVPIPVESGGAKIILNNKVLSLTEMKFLFGSGESKGSGNIVLDLPFPKINMKWNIDDVNYPVFDNSFVSLDGDLILEGSKLPYSFNGDLIVNNGKFEDNLERFAAKESVLKNIKKYIDPKKTGIPDIVNLSLRIKTAESITMKNRISDLLFFGDILIKGNPNEPKLKGKLEVIPVLSKFKFKGNDFTVQKGHVLFDDRNLSEPIGVNFLAETKIQDYEVKLAVNGGVNDIRFTPTSNPPLSHEDIFSLITLGVTTEYTRHLQDKDRASLTTLSLGNLIVDQLRINERLDSTLGLRLSVLPEISESDENPLKAAGSDQQVKLKTSTKLKIQKKVTKNVNLTFSNTFGGSDGQRQEINLDLNLNKNFSIEGVIERVNSPQDVQQEEGSAGADIKYKWSF